MNRSVTLRGHDARSKKRKLAVSKGSLIGICLSLLVLVLAVKVKLASRTTGFTQAAVALSEVDAGPQTMLVNYGETTNPKNLTQPVGDNHVSPESGSNQEVDTGNSKNVELQTPLHVEESLVFDARPNTSLHTQPEAPLIVIPAQKKNVSGLGKPNSRRGQGTAYKAKKQGFGSKVGNLDRKEELNLPDLVDSREANGNSAKDQLELAKEQSAECLSGNCVATSKEMNAPYFGTMVEWSESPKQAAERAQKEDKLVFLIQVSGNFADSRFT